MQSDKTLAVWSAQEDIAAACTWVHGIERHFQHLLHAFLLKFLDKFIVKVDKVHKDCLDWNAWCMLCQQIAADLDVPGLRLEMRRDGACRCIYDLLHTVTLSYLDSDDSA